jgi:hypothetical protein
VEAAAKIERCRNERFALFFTRLFDKSVVDRFETLGEGAHRERNVSSIRHGYGPRTLYFEQITGCCEVSDVGPLTPVDWGLVTG